MHTYEDDGTASVDGIMQEILYEQYGIEDRSI